MVKLLSIVNVTEFPSTSFNMSVLVFAKPAVLLIAVTAAVAPLTSPFAFIQFEPLPFKVKSLYPSKSKPCPSCQLDETAATTMS